MSWDAFADLEVIEATSDVESLWSSITGRGGIAQRDIGIKLTK